MLIPRQLTLWCLATLVATAGCVTVDPRSDYDRLAEQVRNATGFEYSFRPGDERIVSEKVDSLIAGGLTADEAVQVCLLNNPTLQATFLDVGMARADVVQSGLLSNPSLGASLRLPAGGGLANVEAGVAQNIAAIWRIPVRRRAAERSLDVAILEAARQAADLALEAKTAYYRAVAADRIEAISRENLGIVLELLEFAEERQKAGVASDVDIQLLRTELSEMKLTLHSTMLEAFEARSALAGLLGLSTPPQHLDIDDTLPEPPSWTKSAKRLLSLAAEQRLDVRAARQAVEHASANAKLEGLRVFPEIDLGIELERGERRRSNGGNLLAETFGSSLRAGKFTLPTIDDSEKPTEFTIGPAVSLELPLFDQNQAQIAKANYAYVQAVKRLDAVVREVSQEAWLAHERAEAAFERVQIYRDELLPLRQRDFELADAAYQAGKMSITTLLGIERAMLTARTGYINARRDAALVIVELERVTGQPFERIFNHGNTVAPVDPPTTPPNGPVEIPKSGG